MRKRIRGFCMGILLRFKIQKSIFKIQNSEPVPKLFNFES